MRWLPWLWRLPLRRLRRLRGLLCVGRILPPLLRRGISDCTTKSKI
jgi:hypothetical protein